ncbi:MAG: hypothetical protein WCH00_00385 [Candidatus Saccharibacteria bacterium]
MSKKMLITGSSRDQEWLENMLADIWYKYFREVRQDNDVRIVYGRKAKRRLGSISLDRKDMKTSVITINPIYQDIEIPEFVVEATIVHEMTHYAHGFNSPLEQKQKHPHSGGVIRREFAERGLEDLYLQQKQWLKDNWSSFVMIYFPISEPRTPRRPAAPWWMPKI